MATREAARRVDQADALEDGGATALAATPVRVRAQPVRVRVQVAARRSKTLHKVQQHCRALLKKRAAKCLALCERL